MLNDNCKKKNSYFFSENAAAFFFTLSLCDFKPLYVSLQINEMNVSFINSNLMYMKVYTELTSKTVF